MRRITGNWLGQFPLDRLVTRYVGPGIKGVGSGIGRVESGVIAPGSGITIHGIGASTLLRD